MEFFTNQYITDIELNELMSRAESVRHIFEDGVLVVSQPSNDENLDDFPDGVYSVPVARKIIWSLSNPELCAYATRIDNGTWSIVSKHAPGSIYASELKIHLESEGSAIIYYLNPLENNGKIYYLTDASERDELMNIVNEDRCRIAVISLSIEPDCGHPDKSECGCTFDEIMITNLENGKWSIASSKFICKS